MRSYERGVNFVLLKLLNFLLFNVLCYQTTVGDQKLLFHHLLGFSYEYVLIDDEIKYFHAAVIFPQCYLP